MEFKSQIAHRFLYFKYFLDFLEIRSISIMNRLLPILCLLRYNNTKISSWSSKYFKNFFFKLY